MLIIARRKGQRIVIGHDIEVIVTEVTRGTVKFGIVAPTQTTILRGELRDAVEAANRAATETMSDPDELALALPVAAGQWEKPA